MWESVLFNVRDRDLGSTVEEAQDKLNTMMTKLPKGYYGMERSMGESNSCQQNTISDIAYRRAYHILIFTYI
jgi:Cu(I)/Ag(I) efflux system membrane protein CusA/SilA